MLCGHSLLYLVDIDEVGVDGASLVRARWHVIAVLSIAIALLELWQTEVARSSEPFALLISFKVVGEEVAGRVLGSSLLICVMALAGSRWYGCMREVARVFALMLFVKDRGLPLLLRFLDGGQGHPWSFLRLHVRVDRWRDVQSA